MPKPTVNHLQKTGHSWLAPSEPAVPYEHNEYPKRKYHKLGHSRVVSDPAEEKALGTEFLDSWADHKPKPAAEPKPAAAPVAPAAPAAPPAK